MAPLSSYGFLTASCLLLGVNGAPYFAQKSADGGSGNLPTAVSSAISSKLNQLLEAQPTYTPQSVGDVVNYLQNHFKNKDNTDMIQNAIAYKQNGLLPKNPGPRGYQGAFYNEGSQGINAYNNSNPDPPKTLYPSAAPTDPNFSVSESALRSAIYIPPTFNAGNASNPVLLVPGTGGYGGIDYEGNYIKALANGTIAQAVWLNVPSSLLQDAQVNSEYVAYAINYIYAITGRKVNIVAWSQGNLNVQWSMKYFPSTREAAKQHIGISPDFHGTVLAKLSNLGTDLTGKIPQAPALLQQEYNSNFVTRLRENGGDSAYIPTTTFYSGLFDEVVEPQADPYASGHLNDARNVGVVNNSLQKLCFIKTFGFFGNHESLLYNAPVLSLALETLKQGKPVQPNSCGVDLPKVCLLPAYPGLTLDDVIETEATQPIFVVNALQYVKAGNGVTEEPPLMSYASS